MIGNQANSEAGSPEEEPLQPRLVGSIVNVTDPVVLAELQKVEDPAHVERLERLAADAEIIGRLQYQHFDVETDDWHDLSSACAEYGYSVFKGWGQSGVLRTMASRHGGGGVFGYTKIAEGLALRHDDAHELSAELMIVSIEAFRVKTLMHPDPMKRWRPKGGASLRTFFVGRCLMELPDVFEKWHRERTRAADKIPLDHEAWSARAHNEDYQRSTNPDEQAITNLTIEKINEDPLGLAMLRLSADGYSYEEISQMLSDAGFATTVGAVRTRMSRVRQHVRQRRDDWR